MPEPGEQVVQTSHDIWPDFAVKVPAAHGAHTTSLVTVATAVVYMPALHGSLTASHAPAPLIAENVLPAWHAAHARSVEAEPALTRPEPAGQLAQEEHII